ncbi:MAG: C40 family peptidase [Elusimicrobia bacterium]|nr:C40 family peptidase [Elusimicrobiota bacterium]
MRNVLPWTALCLALSLGARAQELLPLQVAMGHVRQKAAQCYFAGTPLPDYDHLKSRLGNVPADRQPAVKAELDSLVQAMDQAEYVQQGRAEEDSLELYREMIRAAARQFKKDDPSSESLAEAVYRDRKRKPSARGGEEEKRESAVRKSLLSAILDNNAGKSPDPSQPRLPPSVARQVQEKLDALSRAFETKDPGEIVSAGPGSQFPPENVTQAPPKGLKIKAPEEAVPALAKELAGLKPGDKDPRPHGPIARVKAALLKWNPRLVLGSPDGADWGRYDENLARALALFKATRQITGEGKTIGPKTAAMLAKLESGALASEPKTLGGKILAAAAGFLGLPYDLGGDGLSSMDCALLTQKAVEKVLGWLPESFTRLADDQYWLAEKNKFLALRQGPPHPGDLIYFHDTSGQASIAHKGVTHAAIYIGDGYMLAASSSYGKVVIQRLSDLERLVQGYAYIRAAKG